MERVGLNDAYGRMKMFFSNAYPLLVPLLCAAFALAPGNTDADSLTLAKKAEVFEADLQERFTIDGQVLCKLKLPTANRDFVAYNMPDNAYMTGIHLGTLSMKYAVTGKEADRQDAVEALRALDLLCTVSGKPGLLARAAWPVDRPFDDDGDWRLSEDGKYKWRGDVSSDQVDGVFYGFSLAYDLVANKEEKTLIAKNCAALADHILNNDLRIVGYDGEPTQWGKYYPDYVKRREPMNALLLLQLLKVAHHATGAPRFADAYERYASEEGYAEIAEKARYLRDPRDRGHVNHSDDVLIFLAYVPLLRYENDPELLDSYKQSLERSWRGNDEHPGVAPENNPFFGFIAQRFLDDVSAVERSVETLRDFPLDMKWNSDTISKYEARFDFRFTPVASQDISESSAGAVPIHGRRKAWSAWVMDPYHSRGSHFSDTGMEYNGHDYLAAYWMGRHWGYIGKDM